MTAGTEAGHRRTPQHHLARRPVPVDSERPPATCCRDLYNFASPTGRPTATLATGKGWRMGLRGFRR